MKFITLFIFAISFYQIGYCQVGDTVRIYDYLKTSDRWKLETKKKKYFTLYANNLFVEDDVVIDGQYKHSDTTIHFICDTGRLKSKSLAREKLKVLTNIPFILTGEVFPFENNIIIPHNINFSKYSIVISKGIFAKYSRGDSFVSNTIELREDSTYVFSHNSCMYNSHEKGRWTLNNGIITFIPEENEWSMFEWITDNKKVYLIQEHLIGKKTSKTYTKSKKLVVNETYFFLSKEPIYTTD